MSKLHKNGYTLSNVIKISNDLKILQEREFEEVIKNDNDGPLMIELSMFGLSSVYTLVDMYKLKSFMKKCFPNYFTQGKPYCYLNPFNKVKYVISKNLGDSPLEDGINKLTTEIRSLSIKEFLSYCQLRDLCYGISLINEIDLNEDCQYDFSLNVINISNESKEEVENEINFSLSDYKEFEKYKYIIITRCARINFSNSIYLDNFNGIFIKINELNCWQYLSKKKYDRLRRLKCLKIKYAYVDDPHCFSNIKYSKEFEMDTIDDILKYLIYIAFDITSEKIFEEKVRNNYNLFTNAFEFELEVDGYCFSLILTYDELGISSYQTSIDYHNKFSLLKIINKIIQMIP